LFSSWAEAETEHGETKSKSLLSGAVAPRLHGKHRAPAAPRAEIFGFRAERPSDCGIQQDNCAHLSVFTPKPCPDRRGTGLGLSEWADDWAENLKPASASEF